MNIIYTIYMYINDLKIILIKIF